MTELFHTDLDDAAMYKARLANVERDRLLDEIASAERDRDTWQRELAIELEQSQALGDALAAAVEQRCRCSAEAAKAARAWRAARG